LRSSFAIFIAIPVEEKQTENLIFPDGLSSAANIYQFLVRIAIKNKLEREVRTLDTAIFRSPASAVGIINESFARPLLKKELSAKITKNVDNRNMKEDVTRQSATSRCLKRFMHGCSQRFFIDKEGQMVSETVNRNNREKEKTVQLLDELFCVGEGPRISVRLWDGSNWPGGVSTSTRIVLKHPGALRAMFLPGHELGLGEAYLYDDFDIDGNCEDVFDLAEELARFTSGWRVKLRAAKDLLSLPADNEHPWLKAHGDKFRRPPVKLIGSRHSQERDRQAVTFHYNVSNEFYKLWLDRKMVYSAAYFQSPKEDIDKAQENKLDYICRKLRLRPGQKFLDIGCGWGALAMHAAARYGVDATGITLSEPQAELANDLIGEAGLRNRCRILVADYRDIEERASYDALASVGMFEHVGEALLPVYFRQAYDLLKPGGVFLNHGIVRRVGEIPRAGRNFVDTYVFPDGELIPVSVTLKAAEDAGFEIRDLESLREHYAMTLRFWVNRLEKAHEEALKYVDEPTYRVWRLYMSGSANGFTRGRINVYQVLLSKSGAHWESGLPLTRADWYQIGGRNI